MHHVDGLQQLKSSPSFGARWRTQKKGFFSFSHVFHACRAHARFMAKTPHLFCEKCVHIYRTQNTAWQSEANWSRWPLLNHITGDHISLFIGHKQSTSVSTWLTFPYEIFESGFFTSTPLLPLPRACLNQLVPRTSKLLFFFFLHQNSFLVSF